MMGLEEELRDFISTEFMPGEDPGALGVDDDLIGSGVLDSLAMVKLVTHLEGRYGVVVAAEELTPENLGSVGRLASFVGRRQAG